MTTTYDIFLSHRSFDWVLIVQRTFGQLFSYIGMAVCANFEGAAGTISTARYGIEQNKADLTACAENILLAREAHFPATIADLYDPEAMPDNVRAAHERNDETLERIYIGRRFKTTPSGWKSCLSCIPR